MQDCPTFMVPAEIGTFSQLNHDDAAYDQFMKESEKAIKLASLQKFATVTAQYPGVRAPIPLGVSMAWLKHL